MSDSPRRTLIKPSPRKDENGSYLPEVTEPLTKLSELTVDGLLLKGLLTIDRTIQGTLKQVTACGGVITPPREAIQNLKDCMQMLMDLRDVEKELLEGLTDEELKEHASKE